MLALSKANLTEHIFKKIKTFMRELRMLCQKQKTKPHTVQKVNISIILFLSGSPPRHIRSYSDSYPATERL